MKTNRYKLLLLGMLAAGITACGDAEIMTYDAQYDAVRFTGASPQDTLNMAFSSTDRCSYMNYSFIETPFAESTEYAIPVFLIGKPAASDRTVAYRIDPENADQWERDSAYSTAYSMGLLARGEPRGDRELRQALTSYLEEYRGVRCTPDQIVVGAGIEYLLSLLAPLLRGPAAVENPGYPRARQVLENSGHICRFLPVDEGGLSVTALAASDAAVCYVTPSHQFPTGVTMPAPRRAELLGWAAARPGQRYIIEDDYDSEFRFDTRPLPSLQGMAGADGPVIYLSTVARSLAPGIRIAYMVLPQHLLPAWEKRYTLYSGTVSRFEQQTLARFIGEGYFTRHLARSRVTYKARRTALAQALTAAFGPAVRLSGLHTGLHLLVQFTGTVPPDQVLAAAARQAGIRLAALSSYYMADSASCPPGTLVLGYGALEDGLCASLAETLKKACTAASESWSRV